jgi:hypothetical protein
MPEREILYGPDVATADFATRVDTDDNNRAKLLETADGATVLLEWDGAAGEWVYGGPVNMDGEDITNVGSISTEDLSITDEDYVVATADTSTSFNSNTWGTILFPTEAKDQTDAWDVANSQFTPTESGRYRITLSPSFNPGADGDRIEYRVYNTTTSNGIFRSSILIANSSNSQGLPITMSVDLSAGDTYEMQVRDRDSSLDQDGFGTGQLIIERQVMA